MSLLLSSVIMSVFTIAPCISPCNAARNLLRRRQKLGTEKSGDGRGCWMIVNKSSGQVDGKYARQLVAQLHRAWHKQPLSDEQAGKTLAMCKQLVLVAGLAAHLMSPALQQPRVAQVQHLCRAQRARLLPHARQFQSLPWQMARCGRSPLTGGLPEQAEAACCS